MWDLNDSPDRPNHHQSEATWVGSVSNSSSYASDEDDVERSGGRKRNGGTFGFSGNDLRPCSPPVTRQFFPPDDMEPVGGGGTPEFPRAHWVGVKFCQTELHAGNGIFGKEAAAQPLKKSRRGPRSRSSQYRGVTFYRRTGRWESHIWYV